MTTVPPHVPSRPDVAASEVAPSRPAEEVTRCGIGEVLREPGGFLDYACRMDRVAPVLLFLAGVTAGGCALFGAALGSFVDGTVAAWDALKLPGIVLFAFALCFPTLYVFACMSGCRLAPLRLAAFGLTCTATLGCVMAALAPVLWLFAVSTESLVFFVWFSCALAGVAVFSLQRPLLGACERKILGTPVGMGAWLVVFVVVALQAATFIRPLLGGDREPQGRCFFLQHLWSVATRG